MEVRFASRRGPNAADDDIAALVAADADPASCAWSPPTPRSSGACASTAREVEGAGAFRRRLDELGRWLTRATAPPSSTGSPARPAARRSARRGRPRPLGRPGGGGRHGRARARLRRHLPARPRAPQRAHGAGGARARPDAWGRRSTPTRPASRRWARWRARAIRRSTTAGLHPTAVCGGVGAAVARGAAAAGSTRRPSARRWRSRCSAPAGCAPRSGRTARRCRWAGPPRPACAPRGWRSRGAGAARGGGARVRRGHRRHLRGARRGRARDRAQLDQGLALLPPDARLDRGRRARARRRAPSRRPWSCTRCRSRRRPWAPSPRTASRRSSRSRT